jgi:hypothetical protein
MAGDVYFATLLALFSFKEKTNMKKHKLIVFPFGDRKELFFLD